MTENFENVNHLVLNFYPDGYSIAVKLNEFPVFTSETILETARISYEETSLLDYIENEELPPLLVEMIDSSPKLSQYKIWHNGCLILEVRDKIDASTNQDNFKSNICIENDNHNDNHYIGSQSAAKFSLQMLAKQNNKLFTTNNSKYDDSCNWLAGINGKVNSSQDNYNEHNREAQLAYEPTTDNDHTKKNFFILLKPTNLSMLYDVLNLTGSKGWSTQERLQLESQIVLHNSPSLTLEPDAPETAIDPVTSWPLLVDAQNLSTSGNKHSKTKSKQLSFKKRLKDIYTNRPIPVTYQTKMNGNNKKPSNNNCDLGTGKSVSCSNTRIQNLLDNRLDNDTETRTPDSLPPELTLQQFLASKRITKKKSLPFSHIPRFHRFKRQSN